jgi:mono/diheme cytochrome c family protein
MNRKPVNQKALTCPRSNVILDRREEGTAGKVMFMSVRGMFSRIVRRLAATTAAVLMLAALLSASPPVGRDGRQEGTKTGQDVFLYACVVCHGADGRGSSRSIVGFDQPLPDFTDVDFASREPNSDWEGIIHLGGPIRGFSQLMPAFGGVLTDKEIRSAVGHLRSFSDSPAWPRGELNFPKPLFTEKAFPEDELIFGASAGDKFHTITGQVSYEQRFGARNQVEFLFPYGWSRTEPAGPDAAAVWTSSLGDAAVAVKRVFHHSLERSSILSGGAELILPTGNRATGFGKGTFVFEPFVLYGQGLPAKFFLQGQAGLDLPFQTSKAESEAYLSLALGRSFFSGRWGRVWSPMVELLAARELVSGAPTNWDIAPQIHVTLNKRRSVMFNIGARIALNNRAGRSTELAASVIWDWFDGGFFEGW